MISQLPSPHTCALCELMQAKSLPSSRVVILGAGSIGVAFAAVLSDAGMQVTVVDPDAERRDGAPKAINHQCNSIVSAGLWRGGQGPVDVVEDATTVLGDAHLVLECGPEKLETKRAIFADLLTKAGPDTLLATASSAITISQIVPDENHRRRCLVAHPVNPPSVLRVIEIVPAPGTSPESVDQAAGLFQSAGFHAVTLGKEIEGFVLNRLQGAVLREAYRLVEEGVSDVAGVDAIMRLGLGPRWALSGPFETAELNTPGGITAHAKRMGPAYKRMGQARGETVEWTKELVSKVAEQRRSLLPEEHLPARAAWRSGAVATLIAKRNELMDVPPTTDTHDEKDNEPH